MSAGRPFRGCACFFTDNIFVGRFGLHVRYRDEPQLRRDHGRALRERGCRSEEQFREVLREIEAEVQRRKQLPQQSVERRAIISKCYKPKHPEVYTLQDSFLAPEFLEIERFCTSPGADLQGLLSYLESFSDKRIYRLPVFTEQFCQALLDELENFEHSDMPKGRPNTMNNYGVLLSELGMDERLLTPLRERLRPLTALLYPELGGACLDSHRAFAVKYALHQDLDLSSHYDNAEVTLNVSLRSLVTCGQAGPAEGTGEGRAGGETDPSAAAAPGPGGLIKSCALKGAAPGAARAERARRALKGPARLARVLKGPAHLVLSS